MPIDLADLSETQFPPKFTITSEQLGELGFRRVYGIDYPYMMAGTDTGSNEDFVGKLMANMGWRMDGLESLSDADRRALTLSDMEAFCHAFVEHEQAIFGGTPRNADDNPLAYVRRAADEAVENRRGPFKSSAALDMEENLRRNFDVGLRMRSLLDERPEPFELPALPRNPIVDTNSILARVEENISRMAKLSEVSAELQATMNDSARSAIREMKLGSDQTERNARRALWVGGAGVATGVIGSVVSMLTWLWTADQQSEVEVRRAADSKTAAQEREADRELMREQIQTMRRNTDLLAKRQPSVAEETEVRSN